MQKGHNIIFAGAILMALLVSGLAFVKNSSSLGSGGRSILNDPDAASIPITLTTDVTGVLPQANGGSNASTDFTAGSILFDDGTSFAQNNSQLFWDNTNFRLGVATVTPGLELSVDGNMFVSGTSTSGGLVATNTLTVLAVSTSSFAGTITVNSGGAGTSTFSNLSLTGNLFSTRSIVAGVSSTSPDTATTTQAFSCTAAGLQTGIIDSDVAVIFEDECKAGQVLRFWIDVRPNSDGGEFQIDMDGLPDINGEYSSTTVLGGGSGTTTPFYMEQGKINRCQAEFMSIGTTSVKASYAVVNCNLGYTWQ